MTSHGSEDPCDVVVIGCGSAGLAAAVSAAEHDPGLRIRVLERATQLERGGNSRWTPATLRLEDPYSVNESFMSDTVKYSGGRNDPDYFDHLVKALPETMEWLQDLGVRLRTARTIFVTSAAQRLLPIGGGERLVATLADEAERRGVTFDYQTTALQLLRTRGGETGGVVVRGPDGRLADLPARAVVIASGGFEGNEQMMTQYFGPKVPELLPLSPGAAYNRGEGITMGLSAGALAAGEWGAFHGEPVDARSTQAEAVVMVFPYGILVNSQGHRFADEGAGLADEICEDVARRIWAEPGGVAWFIGDQRLYAVPGYEDALLTDRPPVTAGSIAELASLVDVPAATLETTVREFNAAVADGAYDPKSLDGKHTSGLSPEKSNWAQPLDRPPFVAYPLACAIVFTFGGLGTTTDGEVRNCDGGTIPGLFAAGECTGVYHGTYPGSTSVMRALVYGRIAGRSAASYCAERGAGE